ncbi:putative D-lactaldehyde dehydrogenase [Atractiella rhizophila]|nr:putative D-lactaldehyde dehydrogenase [Atractiella rhizophila]
MSGQLVLVTGASGYIAAWVCKTLLDSGYRVRGTVRSESKGEYLRRKLGEGFEYLVVEDLEKPDGFDAAFEGNDITAVMHTASPFHFNAKDIDDDLIQPAINGTKSLLNSVKKANSNGSKVKRVVITSSFAAILNPHPPVYTFTEEDWNIDSLEEYEKNGKNTDQRTAYRVSKTLAEKAAWDFVSSLSHDDKASSTFFDIATINPPLVLGPTIHEVPSPDKLNTSVLGCWELFQGEGDPDTCKPYGNGVDVRDVALAHIRALEVPEAGGLRFAISSGPFVMQDLLDAVHSHDWEEKYASKVSKVPKGTPGAGIEANKKQNILSAERARKVLGIEPIKMDKTAVDMARNLFDRLDEEWSK